jgi:hypothetical protein
MRRHHRLWNFDEATIIVTAPPPPELLAAASLLDVGEKVECM